jgi:hypothetical protein
MFDLLIEYQNYIAAIGWAGFLWWAILRFIAWADRRAGYKEVDQTERTQESCIKTQETRKPSDRIFNGQEKSFVTRNMESIRLYELIVIGQILDEQAVEIEKLQKSERVLLKEWSKSGLS